MATITIELDDDLAIYLQATADRKQQWIGDLVAEMVSDSLTYSHDLEIAEKDIKTLREMVRVACPRNCHNCAQVFEGRTLSDRLECDWCRILQQRMEVP